MTTIPTEGFLGQLHADDAQALMDKGRRRRCPAGSLLFMEGDEAQTVLFLLEGQVKILITSSAGREVVLDVVYSPENHKARHTLAPRSKDGACPNRANFSCKT